MKNLLFFLLLGVLLAAGCRDECESYERPKASFTTTLINRVVGAASISADTFVMFPEGILRLNFEADYKKAYSYKWLAGIDTVPYEGLSHTLIFDTDDDTTFYKNNPANITLITEYEPNTICDPEDDGIDTLTKYIHFKSFWEAAIFGRWQGKLENSSEIYTIKIDWSYAPFNFAYPRIDAPRVIIYNLFNKGEDCCHISARSLPYGYREYTDANNNSSASFGMTPAAYSPLQGEGCPERHDVSHRDINKVHIRVSPQQNSIIVEWSSFPFLFSDEKPVKYRFTGNRVL